MSRRRDQVGSATVHAVTGIVLLVTVALVAAVASGLIVGHREAEAAADLAALAGASALQEGDRACAAAASIASANGAELVACGVQGEVVDLRVAAEVGPFLRRTWTLEARARAGPVY